MKYIYLSILFILFTIDIKSQEAEMHPATEIRAVWLTTNWKLDWPRAHSVEAQKEELEDILDQLQRDKFNVVLFQARAQGKTFYKSKLDEKSPYFNGSNGFDPLAFAIKECHKRGMECHAWITTFPMEKIRMTKRGKILERKPDFYKPVKGYWFLDPGSSDTKVRLQLIVEELVANYDIDGIHFDYIRYPDDAEKFPDQATYKKYGQGKTKEQWRRDNINTLVSDLYDTVKSIKKWVQVSSAPLGKYKSLKKGDGWTAYETVYQDAGLWMQQGKHDILFPMMYFVDQDFDTYVNQWMSETAKRPVVPGVAVYKLEEDPQNWSINDIAHQLNVTRKLQAGGQAYFRTEQVLKNSKGIRDTIKHLYQYPAKLPPLTWLSDTVPSHPIGFRVIKDDEGVLRLEWEAPDESQRYTYNVYYSMQDSLEVHNPTTLLVASLRENNYSFRASVGEYGFYYFVTASDRYHNESPSAESVFFVHSEEEY